MVRVVAVSKGRTVEEILILYNRGQRDFAESRVQEAEAKRAQLPADIRWHFIGTLQKNKVAKVVGRYVLLHSVDSFELAEKISRESVRQNLVTELLFQVNISGEPTKHGFSAQELKGCFTQLIALAGIRPLGLMTMAPLTDDKKQILDCFSQCQSLCQELRERYKLPHFTELSMGMSHDYELANQAGATINRIGSLLFTGDR